MAELFCGPGGLALSALLASKNNKSIIKPIWANDIDEDTCNTYTQNIHGGVKNRIVCAPVEEINFKSIPDFDGLSFGFPCNDFSIVGEQKGIKGKFGPLYTYGIKAINEKNPDWFIAENVTGLESENSGKIFNKILKELELSGMGYNVTAHKYKIEEYCVPQKRHMLIVVGIRKDLKKFFLVPKPLLTKASEYVSVEKALMDPPISSDASNN